MEFELIKPSRELSNYVKYYWVLETTPTSPYIHRIIPNGLPELIFYLSDKPQVLDGKKELSDSILVNGQLNSFFDISISKKLSLFSVYFSPHGLSMFLDLPMKEIFNQSVPLRLLHKDAVAQLEDEMQEAKSSFEKAAIVERFLLGILSLKKKYGHNRMHHCLNLIDYTRGSISIKELASQACLSRRQLERTFLDFVGMSPKQFLKIVRFQNILQTKSQNLDAPLTNVSMMCGFYDQSHMIDDFRSFSGLSPSEYFKLSDPYSDYFQ